MLKRFTKIFIKIVFNKNNPKCFCWKKVFQSIEFLKQSIECDSYFCYNRNTVMAVTTESFDWVDTCMMDGKDSDVSSTESSASFNSANYSTLLHAFQETHEEASRLALSNNRLKGMNKWLETRVKQLEDELLQT